MTKINFSYDAYVRIKNLLGESCNITQGAWENYSPLLRKASITIMNVRYNKRKGTQLGNGNAVDPKYLEYVNELEARGHIPLPYSRWIDVTDRIRSDTGDDKASIAYVSKGFGNAVLQAMNGEGLKHDDGKVRYDLLPVDAIDEISKVLTFGATKYADRNWEKGMRWGRLYRAALGHLFSWWKGEEHDAETGLSHLAHAACCVIFLLSYSLRGNLGSQLVGGTNNDDRPIERAQIKRR